MVQNYKKKKEYPNFGGNFAEKMNEDIQHITQ